MDYHALPCTTMHHHAVPCTTIYMYFHARSRTTMHHHVPRHNQCRCAILILWCNASTSIRWCNAKYDTWRQKLWVWQLPLLLNSVQNQETALILAAKKGSMGTVRKLIQHGASVNITNKVTPCTLCFVCVTPGSSLYTGNRTQLCHSCTYVIESPHSR